MYDAAPVERQSCATPGTDLLRGRGIRGERLGEPAEHSNYNYDQNSNGNSSRNRNCNFIVNCNRNYNLQLQQCWRWNTAAIGAGVVTRNGSCSFRASQHASASSAAA